MNERDKKRDAELAEQCYVNPSEFDYKKFADLIRADACEVCAKVCESYLSASPHSWGGTTMAAAIRARGQS